MSACAAGGEPDAPLFIYGSLMAEEVLRALIERTPTCQPGTITGFHRYCVAGQPYPAVAPRDDGRVAGLVLRGLSAQEHAVLDWFEDEEYSKEEVEVSLAAAPHEIAAPGFLPQEPAPGGGTLRAHAYVFAQGSEALHGSWDVEGFLRSKILPRYVDNARLCKEEFFAFQREQGQAAGGS